MFAFCKNSVKSAKLAVVKMCADGVDSPPDNRSVLPVEMTSTAAVA